MLVDRLYPGEQTLERALHLLRGLGEDGQEPKVIVPRMARIAT